MIHFKIGMSGISGCVHKDTIIKVNMGGCSRKYTMEKLYKTFTNKLMGIKTKTKETSIKVVAAKPLFHFLV